MFERDMPRRKSWRKVLGTTGDLFKQTFTEWIDDKTPQLGAALAYYTIFSLAPMILLLLAVVGVLFRDDPAGAWSKIVEQLGYFRISPERQRIPPGTPRPRSLGLFWHYLALPGYSGNSRTR